MTIPSTPFATPDAWIGESLASSAAWKRVFTQSEISELAAAREHASARKTDKFTWTREDFPLPTLAANIRNWLEELDMGRGFLLLKGFPVDRFSKDACAEIYWGIGLHMGRPISQNADGDLLGHVRDTGADPNAYGVRLYKTRAEQDFHTDGADIIGLFCLRAAKTGGVSRIVSSVTVFNELMRQRPDLVPVLFENFPFDTQGQHRPGTKPWFDLPLCRFDGKRLNTFFIPWYIRESQQHAEAPRLTRAQQEIIAFYEETANDPRLYLDMHFEPGDIQFLKNAAILHKRTEYEDWDDPDRKRHLLRLWLVEPNFSAGDQFLRRGIDRTAPVRG